MSSWYILSPVQGAGIDREWTPEGGICQWVTWKADKDGRSSLSSCYHYYLDSSKKNCWYWQDLTKVSALAWPAFSSCPPPQLGRETLMSKSAKEVKPNPLESCFPSLSSLRPTFSAYERVMNSQVRCIGAQTKTIYGNKIPLYFSLPNPHTYTHNQRETRIQTMLLKVLIWSHLQTFPSTCFITSLHGLSLLTGACKSHWIWASHPKAIGMASLAHTATSKMKSGRDICSFAPNSRNMFLGWWIKWNTK